MKSLRLGSPDLTHDVWHDNPDLRAGWIDAFVAEVLAHGPPTCRVWEILDMLERAPAGAMLIVQGMPRR